jgi:hypothetical protein
LNCVVTMKKCFYASVWIKILLILGALLALILDPMVFTYVERNTYAFKKNKTSNQVDQSKIYQAGRYAWGITYTSVAFPSTYQHLKFRGSDLTIYTGTGLTFSIEMDLFFKIEPQNLRTIYSTFGKNYMTRFRDASCASLKNSAPHFGVNEFIFNRSQIVAFMFDRLTPI